MTYTIFDELINKLNTIDDINMPMGNYYNNRGYILVELPSHSADDSNALILYLEDNKLTSIHMGDGGSNDGDLPLDVDYRNQLDMLTQIFDL